MPDEKTVGERDLARFWSKVALPDGNGCMIWLGARNEHGYGRFAVRSKYRRAHRISYEMNVGPILTGLSLDHLCSVRACVAPDHLEAVPQRVNVLRGQSFAAHHAAKTHCPQGHPYDEANTYHSPGGSRVCRACQRAWSANRRKKAGAV